MRFIIKIMMMVMMMLMQVSESHVLEDVKTVFIAVEERDLVSLEDVSASIQARVQRITEVVRAEVERFEAGAYSEAVTEAVTTLEDVTVQHFSAKIQMILENFQSSSEITESDLLGYLDACQLVCEGVRNLRCAVILREDSESSDGDQPETETPEESKSWEEDDNQGVRGVENPPLASEEEIELIVETDSSASDDDSNSIIEVEDYGMRSAVDTLRSLSQEEKVNVTEKVEEFESEKAKFSVEVSKWMEEGNELVRLATEISHILATMTDFIGGEVSCH